MARPEPKVIASAYNKHDSLVEITEHDAIYVIQYHDQFINVRSIGFGANNQKRKYMKMTYAHKGNCIAQVRRLNKLFNTTAFGYKEIVNLNLNQK